MSAKYILENGQPVPCSDLKTWGEFLRTGNTRIAQDYVGTIRVSTVFLGLDHNFSGEGSPVLFETMVFGGPEDQLQERYCLLEQAKEGHARILAQQKANNP